MKKVTNPQSLIGRKCVVYVFEKKIIGVIEQPSVDNLLLVKAITENEYFDKEWFCYRAVRLFKKKESKYFYLNRCDIEAFTSAQDQRIMQVETFKVPEDSTPCVKVKVIK